jgi:ABC-type uncharacterized transport system permease subunit
LAEPLAAGLAATAILATPLLLAATGALVSDRSGVLALGMEGYMLSGAFAAVVGAHAGGPWVGLICGALAGALLAGVYAAMAIGLRADQVVGGLVIDLLALGGTTYANELLVGASSRASFALKVPGLEHFPVPLLSQLPIVGRALFDQHVLVYVALAAVLTVALFLHRTRAGLALRATGEHPLASEIRGIHVVRVRYAAVLTSGLLGGLAGTAISLGVVHTFVNDLTAGRGFIAVAAVFFAGWRPLGVLGACLLFGAADALQVWVNSAGPTLPSQVVAMFPYLVTLVVLAGVAGRYPHPAALGQPFARESR